MDRQVFQGLLGIPGASKHGALCGLVSGGLMFIGIYGKEIGLKESDIKKVCYDYSKEFKRKFYSIECSILRPEGFKPDNPPHLCENITYNAVEFAVNFMERKLINFKEQSYITIKSAY